MTAGDLEDGGPVTPPWDEWATWDSNEPGEGGPGGPALWAKHLEDLSAWVAWLQEAYRFVRLPPCWADHEGLRIELQAFWCQWVSLHAPVDPSQLQNATGTLIAWHDYLRRAATDWEQRYSECEHTSVHVDQVSRPREEFRVRSKPFLDHALHHEHEGRRRWLNWTPLTMDAPEVQGPSDASGHTETQHEAPG